MCQTLHLVELQLCKPGKRRIPASWPLGFRIRHAFCFLESKMCLVSVPSIGGWVDWLSGFPITLYKIRFIKKEKTPSLGLQEAATPFFSFFFLKVCGFVSFWSPGDVQGLPEFSFRRCISCCPKFSSLSWAHMTTIQIANWLLAILKGFGYEMAQHP